MPAVLPSGTVTFLFTDIEDSTRRWEQDESGMSAALAAHDELLHNVVTTAGGVVFAHAGDGIVAAFATGRDAIEAAAAAQRAFASAQSPLRVRMAVHTGETEERDGNYFGPAVNRAARLLTVATGGQVLVSLAAAEVVRDRLPKGLALSELGERSLRSLSRPERVFELTWSSPTESVSVEILVLGPLRLRVGGVDVAVPGTKRRAVLALLASASPSPLSVDSLIMAVWPEEVSGASAAALQSHVSRLRRHLGAAASRLTNGPGGYQLRLEPGELDTARMADLIEQARRTGSTDPIAGLAAIRDARRLWRGPPLEEFTDVEPLNAWRRSLDEQRLAAAELHAQLAVTAGEFQEACEVIGAVVTEDPLRETSVRLLMQALAGSGRAAEALRAAHSYRRLLAEEVGLEPSAALGVLEHIIASGDVAPTRDAVRVPEIHRLPTARSPLIGRDSELAGIARLAQSECLVTLVGPGGVGKTRLAHETATRDRTGREVTMVSLAPVTDPGAIIDVVAAALGLRGNIGDPLEATVSLLQSRPWLLVLDNCEHLLPAVRRLVTTLNSACTELTIVATSTERLGLSSEQVCRVAPLALPSHDQRNEDLARIPAIAVFLERAKRVRSDFHPRDDEMPVIAGIVRRLDGMPLAIELAAGRLASLSVGDLNTRLDRALDLLAGSAEPGDERHSTLRATIEWSYDLLPDDQQRLFRALAMFPDGFDLATAENIAENVGPSADPTTAVAHLVDASMLVATFDGTPRYRMLETLRTFGLDRLAAHQELASAGTRFLLWAERFVNWVDTTVVTADEPLANARLLAELGNLRAAWQLARTRDDLDLMVTIVTALYRAAAVRGLADHSSWALELAADSRILEHPRGASVLGVASRATWSTAGDLGRARTLAETGLALVDVDDTFSRQLCLDSLGGVRMYEGRFDEAAVLDLEAVAVSPWRHFTRASLALAYAGRLDEARRLNEQAASAPSPTGLAMHHYAAGEIDNLAGEWTSAQEHYRHALQHSEISGATFIHNVAAVGLVSVLAAAGEVPAALEGYGELIDYWERTGSWLQQWTTLRNLAELLDQLDDHETASILRTAADNASSGADTTPPCVAVDAPPHGEVDDGAATHVPATRAQALDVARRAISRHLTINSDD